MSQDIAVGIDGSSGAQQALKWALAEAAWRQVPVRLVHSVADPTEDPAYRYTYAFIDSETKERMKSNAVEAGREVVQTALEEAGDAPAGVQVKTVVEHGSPPNVLVAQSKDSDLLVVGSRGLGGFAGLMLGSVSQQTIQHSHCPVTVVPERE